MIRPKTVLLENVRGIFDDIFKDYRDFIRTTIESYGYNVYWDLLNASDFGVHQLRPRAVLVGVRKDLDTGFELPKPNGEEVTVGEALYDLSNKLRKTWDETMEDMPEATVKISRKDLPDSSIEATLKNTSGKIAFFNLLQLRSKSAGRFMGQGIQTTSSPSFPTLQGR